MSHFVKARITITAVNTQFIRKLVVRNLCADVKTPTKKNTAKQLTPEIVARREKYLSFEREFESKVDYSKLSDSEKEIHSLHKGNLNNCFNLHICLSIRVFVQRLAPFLAVLSQMSLIKVAR